MAFTQIYLCPTHGEVDGVHLEDIDFVNDEIYEYVGCAKPNCLHEVKPLLHEGKPVLRPLTDEELFRSRIMLKDA